MTDKLLRASPYHGVRVRIIAFFQRFQSIPLIVYDSNVRVSKDHSPQDDQGLVIL